ncbi:endonuclease domain-containing protein [Microbacterium sp. MC2]
MAAPKKSADDLTAWLVQHGGIAHRADILGAGFGLPRLRAFVRDGQAAVIRRAWVHLPDAPGSLTTAARAGGRVTCSTLARHRGWWMPEGAGREVHVHMVPGSGSPRLGPDWAGVTHWTQPLAPAGRSLETSVEDALAHIALCQPREVALVLWEAAVRCETVTPESLRTVPWRTRAARELADTVQGLSDSGLETLLVVPLRRWGMRVRQQVKLAGRLVDLLVGDRLVIQIDGWEFHSSSAQRTRDIAHDAELRLRGYTVLRFSYAQVVHDRDATLATIRRAVASQLHRAG